MKIKTPDCPSCGMPPRHRFFTPYICVNDDCEVLSWPPDKTLAEIRAMTPTKAEWKVVKREDKS